MERKKSKQALTATWMGTAGLYLDDGATGVYIDPFVSRPGLLPVAFGLPLRPRQELIEKWVEKTGGQEAAAVLVSHSHYDHLMDAPFFAMKTGAVLAGSPDTLMAGRGAGMEEGRLLEAAAGDTLRFGRFKISFIESEHGPALFGRVPFPGRITSPLKTPATARRYRLGGVYSLLINHPGGTILHHGSAGFRPGMYDGVRAHTVFLGIAGRGETAPYLEAVAGKTGARVLVPFHFDNFFRPLGEPLRDVPGLARNEFIEMARRVLPGCAIQWPRPGEPMVM